MDNGMRTIRFAVLMFLLRAVDAGAGPVTGTVRVQAREGVQPATAIVYAEPLDAAAPRKPGAFKLMQKSKAFTPRVLAIPVGSTVAFPNEDSIFHNVFSLSPPAPFDLGLYRAGASKTQTFSAPATYRVFCNIHPQMTALIVVVPTPFVTLADANGAFTLDLPPGRYKLTAVSERAAAVSSELKVGASTATAPELTLDESQFVATTHRNKYGQDYPKDAWVKP
jgi:plastocyanin